MFKETLVVHEKCVHHSGILLSDLTSSIINPMSCSWIALIVSSGRSSSFIFIFIFCHFQNCEYIKATLQHNVKRINYIWMLFTCLDIGTRHFVTYKIVNEIKNGISALVISYSPVSVHANYQNNLSSNECMNKKLQYPNRKRWEDTVVNL